MFEEITPFLIKKGSYCVNQTAMTDSGEGGEQKIKVPLYSKVSIPQSFLSCWNVGGVKNGVTEQSHFLYFHGEINKWLVAFYMNVKERDGHLGLQHGRFVSSALCLINLLVSVESTGFKEILFIALPFAHTHTCYPLTPPFCCRLPGLWSDDSEV